MRRRLLICCFLVGATASYGSTVTRMVRTTGQAAVIAGDVAAARDGAQRAALREAVESGVGVLISSITQASNYVIIEDEIFSATRGFVRSFDVVGEGRSEDGLTYQITVDAQVDLQRLEEKIASIDLAHAVAGRPRFVCRGAEFDEGRWQWSAVATQQLLAAMRPLGQRLEPASAAEGSLGMTDADLAKTYLADVLVDGRVRYSEADAVIPGSDTRLTNLGVASRTATVTLEIRWLDQASPLRRWTSTGRGAATTPRLAQSRALTHAVTTMEDTLRAVLLEDLRSRAYGERIIQILIEGRHELLAGIETRWTASGFLGTLQPHA